MTRAFTWRQKRALFQIAAGRCEQCGAPLAVGWHGDHVQPFSAGGATDVINGQALCPTCNLRKGAKVKSQIQPWQGDMRRWQQEAVVQFTRSEEANFLTVATPGAGKTRFALRLMHQFILTGQAQYVIVVVPTAHLKEQTARAAHKAGIHLDPKWSNQLNGMIGGDYHGVVVTYQQVAADPEVFRAFCSRYRVFVVLDEIHHAGDDKAWGTALRYAFSHAVKRLLLSGTPFRGDGNPIPFVTYENGRSKADYNYGYSAALDDKQVCRHVWFPSYEGNIDWISGGEYFSATFADEIEERRENERLRAAIDVRSDWLKTIILEADRKLHDMRLNGHPNAAGLVIARDQYHARDIQRLIKRLTGRDAMIAISDDPEASSNISLFANGMAAWLVAVKMVSEGVDIPRLRIGIYATVTTTELFFRQAVGRFVRWTEDAGEHQDAYLFMPADPRLLKFALAIMEERDHQAADSLQKLKAQRESIPQAGDDTRGLFVPISATDARPDVLVIGDMRITQANLAYTRTIMEQAGYDGPVEHMAKVLHLAGVFKEDQSIAVAPEQPSIEAPMHVLLKQVKKEVTRRVHKLHLATNEMMNHGEIWNKLEKCDGAKHNEATVDQHLARAGILDQWIIEVLHGR